MAFKTLTTKFFKPTTKAKELKFPSKSWVQKKVTVYLLADICIINYLINQSIQMQ